MPQRCPKSGLLVYEFYDIEYHWSLVPEAGLEPARYYST